MLTSGVYMVDIDRIHYLLFSFVSDTHEDTQEPSRDMTYSHDGRHGTKAGQTSQ